MQTKKSQSSGKSIKPESLNELAPARPDARAARTGRTGAGRDAPPSNTASHKCNLDYFQPLRWGVDSLYLTYPGIIFPEVDTRLKNLKKIAQSSETHEQAQAQYQIGDHIFEVKDKAPRGFAYVLEDGAFRIQISRSSMLPCAYVKISSGYLAHVGPANAEESFCALVNELIDGTDSPKVSRIDLFVDFASSECMEWDRQAWVTRASDVDSYSEKGIFTGWVVGKGGIISARLYFKLLHAEKIGTHYLLELWRESGWDGVTPVWRLEIQLRRELLNQFGLSGLPQVLNHLNGLWSYATTEWLRLTLPSQEDKTRSRWPVHPLWGYLSSIDWETDGGPLTRSYTPSRVPGDNWLLPHAESVFIAFMAREGIADLYQAQEALMTAVYNHLNEKANGLGLSFDAYIAERLAIKTRQFNTILNNPSLPAKLEQDEIARQEREYRRASRGGV
ncbi:MAG: replication initiation factor [Betaproteobacteria bacterium]|nr:replication initiation factor [Betaproteobacteria bacterium]